MTALKAGDKAPYFEGITQDGDKVSLNDFKGKKLILYFYPKDDTPGCTAEACNFRDHYASLTARDYAVAGVSVDSIASHQKFAGKYKLPFTLIADEDKKIVQDYGVWGEKNMFGNKFMGVIRTTFVIDEAGVLRHVIKRVNNENAAGQILTLEGEALQNP